MCFNKNISKNYWNVIHAEKNVRIRERREEQIRWYTDLIFALVLGGGLAFYLALISDTKNLILLVFIAITSILSLSIGIFLVVKFLRDYYKVTEDYIIEKNKVRK